MSEDRGARPEDAIDEELEDADVPDDADEPDGDGADDEPGDEPEEGEEGEEEGDEPGDEPEPRQEVRSGRRDGRIARLSHERSEARREATELRRRLEALEAQTRQTQPRETPEQRAQRLAQMLPEERTEYLLNEANQRHSQELNSLRFETADRLDHSDFRSLCREQPAFRAVADEVERELAAMRSRGQNVSREALATYLIGKRALDRARGARDGQERRADGRRRRQTVRAPRGGSDVPPRTSRRSPAEMSVDEFEAAFGNQPIR